MITTILVCLVLMNGPEQPTRQTTGDQKQSAPDRRGTEQAPLIVKVQPTLQTEKEASQREADRQEATNEKSWDWRFGMATAFVGLLQAVLIGFQIRIASQQNKIIRNQSEIMTTNAAGQSAEMRESIAQAKAATEETGRIANQMVESNMNVKVFMDRQKELLDSQGEGFAAFIAAATRSADATERVAKALEDSVVAIDKSLALSAQLVQQSHGGQQEDRQAEIGKPPPNIQR